MRPARILFFSCATVLSTLSASAAVIMQPLSTFGGGDGWLSPGEGGQTFLGTANNERGLAFGNNHLYLVSRASGSTIRILNSSSGAEVGTLNNTGLTGGTFVVNAAATGGDGAIYVANLTTQSTTSAFKVYKWATEASTPTVAYSGDSGLAGSRVGDSLAAFGSGSSTRLAAGYGSTPSIAGNNGYSIVDPTAGSATAVGFTGTPPNAGDFRLSITFADSSHVIGTQGGTLYRYTSFSGTSGTLVSSAALNNSNERLLALATVGGIPLLATENISSADVRIYDVSNPGSPVFVAGGNNTTGTLTANTNGTGQLTWSVNGSTATLYAMSTNQGIEAFTISVPEPGSIALLTLGVAMLGKRKRS